MNYLSQYSMKNNSYEDPMEDIKKEHAIKKIEKKKLTVGNGGFQDIDQKQEFNKNLIVALAHEGFNILSIANKLKNRGVSRSTIYNYMAEDKVFEKEVKAGMLQRNQIKAMVGLIDNIDKGDLAAQKYFLDRTKYFEKRQDIAEQNDYSNPNGSIITIKDDVESIAASLVDEQTLNEMKKNNENLFMKSLEARDEEIQGKFKRVREKMNNEQKE